jgi:hypothetical protein
MLFPLEVPRSDDAMLATPLKGQQYCRDSLGERRAA